MSASESKTCDGDKSVKEAPKQSEGFKELVCGYRFSEFIKKNLHIAPVDKLLYLSTRYLECKCTIKYGFHNEVSQQLDMSNSISAIPSIFDSAFIIELMDYAGISLSSPAINSVRRILLENLNESGLWSFFHKEFMISLRNVHAEVDTSSVAASALLSCGVDKKIIGEIAENIFRNVSYHEGNFVEAYFSNLLSSSKQLPIGKRSKVKRVCLGVIANFLYLQNRLGNQDLEKLNASYEFLNKCITVLRQHDQNILEDYLKFYCNLDLVCFLISRLKSVAQHPDKINWKELAEVVMSRLERDESNVDVVTLASRILAGLALELHEMALGKTFLLPAIQNLINLQKNDGSFPKYGIYNGSKHCYFGSTAISTALAVAAIKMAKEKFQDLENEINI